MASRRANIDAAEAAAAPIRQASSESHVEARQGPDLSEEDAEEIRRIESLFEGDFFFEAASRLESLLSSLAAKPSPSSRTAADKNLQGKAKTDENVADGSLSNMDLSPTPSPSPGSSHQTSPDGSSCPHGPLLAAPPPVAAAAAPPLAPLLQTTKATTKTTITTTTTTTTTTTKTTAKTTATTTSPGLPPLTNLVPSASPVLNRTYRVCGELQQMMREFETADGWELKSKGLSSREDQILYRLEKDGTHSFRVEGFIDAPLFNLCALVYEFDLFCTWFPLLKHASELGVASRFCKFARLVAWAPWPMADREVVLRGYGDVFEGDSVAIFAKDAVPEDLMGTSCEGKVDFPPEGENGTCRINVHKCGFHFAPVVDEEELGRVAAQRERERKEDQQGKAKKKEKKKKKEAVGAGGRVLVRVFFNVDLKIDFLPDFLLNLIIGKFCGAILLLVRRHAHPRKMLGSEYERRIAANTDVYDEMKRRLSEHLTPEKIRRNCEKYGTPRQREVLGMLEPVTL